jgi:putative membrane protein
MLPDLTLAALHHLLIFGLVAMLASESTLLRGPVDTATVRHLAGIDRGYGLTAVLLLIVGMLRIFHGIKGEDFYFHNPWFHAKLSAYLLAAVISILPTIRFLRWRRALRADPGFMPDAAEVSSLRKFIRAQLALIAAIFVLAAAMARYGGF